MFSHQKKICAYFTQEQRVNTGEWIEWQEISGFDLACETWKFFTGNDLKEEDFN